MQDGGCYAGLADAANQIALNVFVVFFFLPPNVRTIFLEGSAKIWVDKRMRTKIEQVLPRRLLLYQLVILVDSLFRCVAEYFSLVQLHWTQCDARLQAGRTCPIHFDPINSAT